MGEMGGGGEFTIGEFVESLNNIYPELEFTPHYSRKEITFLDTLVSKDDEGNLTFDLYQKSTDRNSLLLYSSNHQRATRESLPSSQFKRLQRIVSDPTQLDTRITEMTLKFWIGVTH